MTESAYSASLTANAASLLPPWIAHYDEGVPAHVQSYDQPLYHVLDEAATHYPHRNALTFQNTHIRTRLHRRGQPHFLTTG